VRRFKYRTKVTVAFDGFVQDFVESDRAEIARKCVAAGHAEIRARARAKGEKT
jgi:hypothetical protein